MSKIKNYQFIKKLQSLPFVEEIWLFGSRARGDNHERSDIDLAILSQEFTNQNWSQLLAIIENADTLLKIDCIQFVKENISDELYRNILKDKKIIYMKETHWKDYFNTLSNAINRLRDVIDHPLLEQNDYMRDASIQRFEFTIELFWKLLKKILHHEKLEATTPRDTLSKAYQYKLIDSEEIWLQMLDDRNNTSHAYKEIEAKRIFENIKSYLPIFETTYTKLKNMYKL